jgi:hypothetical protein
MDHVSLINSKTLEREYRTKYHNWERFLVDTYGPRMLIDLLSSKAGKGTPGSELRRLWEEQEDAWEAYYKATYNQQ